LLPASSLCLVVPIAARSHSDERLAADQKEFARRRLRGFVTEGSSPDLGP
jgi:hypothetical protein